MFKVGHQFQLRLSELQVRHAPASFQFDAFDFPGKTGRSSTNADGALDVIKDGGKSLTSRPVRRFQLQEQRDREVVASSEMFKKLEEKAVKEVEDDMNVEYKTRIQQILDMNAKLQKEKVIASNLQAISNKSRWAFSSYQNDILVKKVVTWQSNVFFLTRLQIAELKSEVERQLRVSHDVA
eukprot:765775-Hanusia_phi.AAC.4